MADTFMIGSEHLVPTSETKELALRSHHNMANVFWDCYLGNTWDCTELSYANTE
jgi:hypothetical protein